MLAASVGGFVLPVQFHRYPDFRSAKPSATSPSPGRRRGASTTCRSAKGDSPMSHHIAFLGTGIMGAPMAAKLIKAGFTAAVWNRTRSKTDPLAVQEPRFPPCDIPEPFAIRILLSAIIFWHSRSN